MALPASTDVAFLSLHGEYGEDGGVQAELENLDVPYTGCGVEASRLAFDKQKAKDNPEEIPELVRMIREEGFDLVSGWKKKRYDSKIRKNLPSKLFNAAARKTSGLKLHDFNCGLKAYKMEVVKNVDVYGEMHRYIPVLAKNAGFHHIGEKVVQHQARKYGTTKFGMDRFINGFLDLITIHFLARFGKRPMHLFGLLGTLMFVLGFASALYIGVVKLLKLYWKEPTILITDNPWFYIALSCMIIGSQFFLAGFVGELILRSKERPSRYQVRETLNLGTPQQRKSADK